MYHIYTDGSAILNQSAGYGFVILDDNDKIIHEGFGKITELPLTNQHAEVLAVYMAIHTIHTLLLDQVINHQITIYSDSEFTIKTMTEWGPKRKDWTGKAYANYFIPMLEWVSNHRKTNFIHVRGHSGVKYNELADRLAYKGRTSE